LLSTLMVSFSFQHFSLEISSAQRCFNLQARSRSDWRGLCECKDRDKGRRQVENFVSFQCIII